MFGRGELQLAILIENMRREGFEFSVSPPSVVLKQQGNTVLEPMEEVIIDVDPVHVAIVIELLGQRKADILELKDVVGKTRILAQSLSRTLLGFRVTKSFQNVSFFVVISSCFDRANFCLRLMDLLFLITCFTLMSLSE